VTSGHDVADARLHRVAEALVRRGLTVEVLGTGVAENGPAGVETRTAPQSSRSRRAVRALTWPWRARGKVVVTIDPDTVASAWLRRRLGRERRWVADVHEDFQRVVFDRDWVLPALRPVIGSVVSMSTKLVGRADLTVTADEQVPPGKEAARERLVVRNEPDLSMLPESAGSADGPLRALYVGDLRPSRGLNAMVEAVAEAPGWHVDLVGPMSASDQAWLTGRIQADDLIGRVTWHGRQPPREAWRAAATAQVGLCLLEDTPAFREAVPSKVYEYLACGLAIIATPLPRVAALLGTTGGGVLADDAEAAAAQLRRWAEDRAELARVMREAKAASSRFGSAYDLLAERVAALVAAGTTPQS